MIRQQEAGFTLESNMAGLRQITASIDASALVHIMDTLGDLYTDSELAVIREYSTNALDSHREAGQTRPIEVTLPSEMALFFTVKDYGVGLSADDIENIYSKYGASTKTHTNDAVGMLGFGCKSALPYSNQFTLVGIKDGIRTTVSISRNEDRIAILTIVDESPTDEPNGVEVTIPTQRYNNFAEKTANFYRFWAPGTVLVNGKEPDRINGLKVTDDILIVRNSDVPHDVVVMGNVPYPVTSEYATPGLNRNYHYVARVPIGTVTFPPSREGLLYRDSRTTDALKVIGQTIKDEMPKAIARGITQASNLHEATRLAIEWRGKVDKSFLPDKIVYGNREIPDLISAPQGKYFTVAPGRSYKLNNCDQYPNMALDTAINALWIRGWDQPQLTAATKKKLLKYCEDQGIQVPPHFVLCSFPFTADMSRWIDKSRIVRWEVIKAIKLPRKIRTYGGSGGTTTAPRVSGSYEGYVNGKHQPEVLAKDIDTNHPVYYDVVRSGYDPAYARNRIFDLNLRNFTYVVFYSNRKDKFVRDFPMAQEAGPAANALRDAFVKSLTKVQKEHIAICQQGYRLSQIKIIDPDRVEDPAIKRAARMIKNPPADLIAMVESYGGLSFEWNNPLDNYPLLSQSYNVFQNHKEHCYAYVNAAYREIIAKKPKPKTLTTKQGN